MTDINVEEFFKDSAKILTTLYLVFPRRHTLFVADVCGPEEPDEFGMHSERYLSCLGTLLWLGEEGYLRFEETIRFEAIDQAILTGRCFTLLSSPTRTSLEPSLRTDDSTLPISERLEQATAIHHIRHALNERSSTMLRIVMMDLMLQMNDRNPV